MHELSLYFRHCCVTAFVTPPTQHYHVWVDKAAWHLSRNNSPPLTFESRLLTAMYLYLNITAQLVRGVQGYTVFHAAGLARHGAGLIICGPSDSGKSTLTTYLVTQGYDFATDEMVAVANDGQTVNGLPCPLILQSGSAFLWQNAPRPPQFIYATDDDMWLDPDHLRPHCVQTALTPQLLIFPQYQADSAFEVTPVSPAQAMFRLMQRVINFAQVTQKGVPAAKWLAQHCPAYHLTYSDMGTVNAWLEAHLTT